VSLRFTKALVVGASSGIGEAIALALARSGAAVAVVARRGDMLAKLEEELRRSGASAAFSYAHDVTSYEETPGLFERIVHDLQGLDLVVYAAGVMPEAAEGEYSFGGDRAMVEVNLLGAIAWLDLAAPCFEAQRSGTIVGISSVAGERGRRGNPVYCTSKAALTTYLESLRNRLSRYGVNVVTVKPGFVDTAMTRGKQGLFWLISPAAAAEQTLALARRGSSPSGFVPRRWALIAWIVRNIPSFVFRKLNF